MATWQLSTASKKNAVEKQYWYKEGVTIIREEGYRWGTFYCESDEQPEVDLENEDGYDLTNSKYDWELDSLDDGCWVEWDFPEDMDEEEQERIIALCEDDFIEGLEGDGWINDDTEYLFYGPLELKEIDE